MKDSVGDNITTINDNHSAHGKHNNDKTKREKEGVRRKKMSNDDNFLIHCLLNPNDLALLTVETL